MQANKRKVSDYLHRFLLVAIAALTLTCCTASMASASSWSAPTKVYTPPSPGWDLEDLSCPTTTFCVAVDNLKEAVRYNDGSWSNSEKITDSGFLEAVSCGSPTFCFAITEGLAIKWNGSTWGTPGGIGSSSYYRDVSCPSSSFCAAIDSKNHVVTYNGSTWSSQANILVGRPSSISCSSSSFCAAGDESGYATTYNGSTWSAPKIVGTGRYVLGMSCPTSTFCAASDDYGRVFTYNGSTWSDILDISGPSLYSMSCPTATFCMSTGAGFDAHVYNGSGWSTFSGIDSHGYLHVSCPTVTFCIAVDSEGYATTYTGDPVPVNTQPPTITGVLVDGNTLQAVKGTWTNNPFFYNYQWERCTSEGTNCVAVTGQTLPGYFLLDTDVGYTFRVTETGVNATGPGSPATSSPTAVVQAAPPVEPPPKEKEPEQPNGGGSGGGGSGGNGNGNGNGNGGNNGNGGSGGNKGGNNGGSGNGGFPIPPGVTRCDVPNLIGKTLFKSKRILANHGCKIGKIKKPKPYKKRRRQVVVKQSPAAGKILRKGARINLSLR